MAILGRHYIAGERGRLSKFLMCAIAVDAFLRLLGANVSIIIDVATFLELFPSYTL